MRDLLLPALLLTMSAHAAPPAAPPRTEQIRLESPAAPKGVLVKVWLPPRFAEARPGTVPLLVFLHDGFGSQRSFFRNGLDEILRGMIDRGEAPLMVIACPRAVGTFNSNDVRGRLLMFDFLSEALVPELLARYPALRRDRAGHGLTGISVGGYGSLKIALRRPESFGAASALSPWIEDLSFDFQRKQGFFMRWALGRIFGKTADTSTIRSESLFEILRVRDAPTDRAPALFLLTGDQDPWFVNGNHERFEQALRAAGVRYESRMDAGAHEWRFWKASFPGIVRFHAKQFAE